MRIGFLGKLVDEPEIRAGFIGCGSHSYRHIYPTFQFAPVSLAATCDLDIGKVRAFAAKFGAKSAYDDYRVMLEREELDAVFVVTGYDDIGRPLYPDLAITTFATVMILENLILIPLALAIADAGDSTDSTPLEGFLNALKGLARNPIFLSILLALAYSVSGLTQPDPLMRPIEMLRPIASPIALFAVGGTVAAARSVRGMVLPAGAILSGKLILHPLFVLAAALMVPDLPREILLVAVVNAACPMLSIYPLFGLSYGRELLTSATLMVTTAASFVTISSLLWIISASGG